MSPYRAIEILVRLFFPIRLYPWVIVDMTDIPSCARYLERDFLRRELGRPSAYAMDKGFMEEKRRIEVEVEVEAMLAASRAVSSRG